MALKCVCLAEVPPPTLSTAFLTEPSSTCVYTFSVVSTLACPISCAVTFPGTPFSCDHDEYVRRNVNHVAFGSPNRSHAEKIAHRSTLVGRMGVP